MTSAILAIIAGIAASVSGYFAYKNSPLKNRREAEKDIDANRAEFFRKKQAIKNAVFSHDENRLNELLHDLAFPILIGVLFSAIFSFSSGCASSPVYIPENNYVEPCTNSHGAACWAVPDSLMLEIMARLQTLQNLERENAVNNRLK